LRRAGDRPPTARIAGEGGFTLPELLVGILLTVIVAGAAMAVVSFATRTQPQASERAGQLQQGRTMIEQVTREVRQGEAVTAATASSLQILTKVHSATCGGPGSATAKAIACQVTYSCTTTACQRTVRNPDGTGSAPTRTMLSGISSSSVFSYSPSATNPSYVGVTLVYPSTTAADGEAVTLSDGAALRNWFEDG
jgi:type II secretory pathway pseudopilin PulG